MRLVRRPFDSTMWSRKPRKPSISSPSSSPPAPVLSDPSVESVEHALIGEALVFNGEASGTQDLTVNGRFEGTVSLSRHTITVGRNGRVQGDILARVIRIEGHVEGNLQGEELVFLGPSGVVHGDLTTARVSMEEGCEFRGHVQFTSKEHPASELSVPLTVRRGHRTDDPAPSKPLPAPPDAARPFPGPRPQLSRSCLSFFSSRSR